MLQGDSQAQLAELRANLAGSTVVDKPRRGRPGRLLPGVPAPPGHAMGGWEMQRPLEGSTAVPPQVPYSRGWDRLRGRFCRLRATGGGLALNLLRGRRP